MMSRKKPALAAVALAVAAAAGSCWLPPFDPAVALSALFEDFLDEYAVAPWSRDFSLQGVVDSSDEEGEFLPFRMPGYAGGWLVGRSPSYFRVARVLLPDGSGITAPTVDWSRGDYATLGYRAYAEPMGTSTDSLLVLRDPLKGLERVRAHDEYIGYVLNIVPYETEQRLLAFGSVADQSADAHDLAWLVHDPGDGTAAWLPSTTYGFRRISVDSTTDPTNATWTFDTMVDSGASLYGGPPPGAPGWMAPDADAMAGSGSTVRAAIGDDAPALWKFGLDPATSPDAAMGAALPLLPTGTLHGAAGPILLAEGAVRTELYDSDGTLVGALPTGSWRFGYEYWEPASSRWIAVFSRCLVLPVTDQPDDVDVSVRAVPVEALLGFAASKL